MQYIGLDVGTSGCKAALMDESGKIITSASREYFFEFPQKGFVELNPFIVWGFVKEVLCEIAPKSKNAKAIAVSSIGEAMAILDKNDRVLTNGIIYLDQRCNDIVKELAQQIDKEELFAITGVPLNQIYTLNKFPWYKRNMPEVLECADKYFLFGDYITYMLCGERAIDAGSASRTLFFDGFQLKWSDSIAQKFDIPTDKFSKVTDVGTVLGKILKSIATETGLPSDLDVIMGCHDQNSATLGAGALKPGDFVLGEGTSESLNLLVDSKNATMAIANSGFGYEPFVIPGMHLVPVGQNSHGTCIKWFVRMFENEYRAGLKEGESVYRRADEDCAKNAGELYFLPYMSKASTTETKGGVLGGFTGLEISVDRNVMYRAVLEGLCYETRSLMELIESYQLKIDSITATGGASKSPLYMQMKSDMLGKKVSILNNAESGIAGLGMICAVACKDFNSYEEASAQFVSHKAFYEPQRNYDKGYRNYKRICDSMTALYQTME